MRAWRFVANRLVAMAGTVLIASFLIFGSLYLAPGSPITLLTGGRSTSPEVIAGLEAQYGLDDPFLAQYWHWLTDAVRGDLGTSIIYNQSVSSLVAPLVVNTVCLVAFAALIIVSVGLALGVVAGLRAGWLDTAVMTVATATSAVPAFVAAAVLTLIFAVQLTWLPVYGAGTGVAGRLQHLTLPAVALALASVAIVARLTRAAVRQELVADHVQTAISRGLPYRSVVRRHVLRNAAVPMVTFAGLNIVGLVGGSVVIEQVFQLNGLGSFLVASVQAKDFPPVQAICLLYAVGFVVLNTLVDLSYGLLDPRIAAGRRAS